MDEEEMLECAVVVVGVLAVIVADKRTDRGRRSICSQCAAVSGR
jgi:hypothetical protein